MSRRGTFPTTGRDAADTGAAVITATIGSAAKADLPVRRRGRAFRTENATGKTKIKTAAHSDKTAGISRIVPAARRAALTAAASVIGLGRAVSALREAAGGQFPR